MKHIREQFNINDLDFNSDDSEISANIFNKEIVLKPADIYNLILNGGAVDDYNIKRLNKIISKIKVRNKKELKILIKYYSDNHPLDSLNWIDVSEINDMSYVFKDSMYNGNISKWDVHRVETMEGMFMGSQFNQNISKWDVFSNVIDMSEMFRDSQFN